MAKIRFDNGVVVNFNGNPTPQDIEDVAQKLGINKKKSNLLTDVRDSFKGRVNSLSEGYARQMAGGQSTAESLLQTVGQGAGLVGDVAFSGATRFLSAATPNFIEKPIVKAGGKLLQKAVSTPLVSGALDKYQQFSENQPRAAANIGAVANIGSLVPIGKAGSIVGKVASKTALKSAEVAGKVGGAVAKKGAVVTKFGLSQASGLNRETIEQIIKNPSLFNRKTVNELTRESLGKQVKQGIVKRIEELQSVGKGYEPIRKTTQIVDVPIDTYTNPLTKYGLQLNNEGKLLVTAESKPFSVGELNQVENFLQQYGGLQHTPNSALNAREALSNLAKYDMAKSNNLTSLAKDMRSSFNSVIRNEKTGIQGLKKIDDVYSRETGILKEIKKDYFVKGSNEFKDNAISKIANLTKEGRQSVLGRLKQIDSNIEGKVNILRAIEDIKASGGFKVGTYARGAAAVGGAATGNIGLILTALASQPEILVPILRAWGKFRLTQKGFVSKLENNLVKGVKLATDEKSFINQAINDYAKKITDKINNIKPGLTIEDVSKKPLKSTPLVNNKSILGTDREFAKGLTTQDKIIERKAFAKIDNKQELNKILKDYKAKNGKVVNTDALRPFFKDVGYVGHRSASVQEPASEVSKKAFLNGLESPGKYATLFAGGSGTGKTSAIKNVPSLSSILDDSSVVLDGNLSSMKSAMARLGEATTAGKKVPIIYVYRGPMDSLMGIIKRGINNIEEAGRIVPNKITAGNHIGSWNVIKELYKNNNFRDSIYFIDNSLGAGKAKLVTYDDLVNKIKYPSEDELIKMFNNKVKELYESNTKIGKRAITAKEFAKYLE